MPSFNCTVEFEVFCETCGAGLCNSTRTEDPGRRAGARIHVSPCEACLEKAKEDSFNEGVLAGKESVP